MTADHVAALERANGSLEGLSVGDAFGECFFVPEDAAARMIALRSAPSGVWPFTDDTNMALSIVGCLGRFAGIDQDWLARSFAERYHPMRGYGPAMHGYLHRIRSGADWRSEAPALFDGAGSFGNGAAVRAAPIGAYFAGDPPRASEQARLSAEVTHAHPEGIAGAVAVAVAASVAAGAAFAGDEPLPDEFIEAVLDHIPAGDVREMTHRAVRLPTGCTPVHAAAALGAGYRVSAQDTAPFCIWCAANSLDDYEEAMWATVSGLGDRDTTCAIVGGIVGAYVGVEGIPPSWRARREPLPDWLRELD